MATRKRQREREIYQRASVEYRKPSGPGIHADLPKHCFWMGLTPSWPWRFPTLQTGQTRAASQPPSRLASVIVLPQQPGGSSTARKCVGDDCFLSSGISMNAGIYGGALPARFFTLKLLFMKVGVHRCTRVTISSYFSTVVKCVI